MTLNTTIVGLVAAGAVVFYLKYDPHPPIQFMDTKYGYVEKVDKTGVTNLFFVRDGLKLEHATDFIQILEFDDEMPETSKEIVIARLLKFYRAESYDEDLGQHFGVSSSRGTVFAAYGAPVLYDGEGAFAVYINITPEISEAQARADAPDIFTELDYIQ